MFSRRKSFWDWRLYCTFLLSGSLVLQVLSLNAVEVLFLSFYSVYFHCSIILMQLFSYFLCYFYCNLGVFSSFLKIIIGTLFSILLSFFLSRNHTPISLAFFICCARFSSFACYFSPPALFQVFCYLHSVTENVGKIDFVVVCALCFGNNNQSFCKFFKVLERKVNFFHV